MGRYCVEAAPPDVMSTQNRIPNGLGMTKYSIIQRRGVLLHTRETYVNLPFSRPVA